MRYPNSTPKQSLHTISAILIFSLTFSLHLATSLATTVLNNKSKLLASRLYMLQP